MTILFTKVATMSKGIWRDCEKQPPLVDDGELVLMDSNDKFWVGFCKITSGGVSYFANNADPFKNDFVKYARIEKLLAVESEFERICKALDVAVDALKEQQRWFGVIRVSLISHVNNEYGTLFKSYDADPTVVNIKRANDILNRALEQITALEQKDVK